MAKTILLADDSVTIRKVVELTFMDEDYEVVAVASGDEALAQLDAVAPDIIIADIHMPGADGYEVARTAKSRRPEVPVLLLVGTFEQFDPEDVAASGADRHLKKPFDSQELLRLVDELLSAAPAAPPPPPPEVEGSFRFEEDLPSTMVSPPLDLTDSFPSTEEEAPIELSAGGEDESTEEMLQMEGGEPPLELEPDDAELSIDEAPGEEPVDFSPEPEGMSSEFDDLSMSEAPASDLESEEPAAAAFEPEELGDLSEDDVDRIARRVVEYLTDEVVRDLAWEILPDLAEIIVKARLRELEGQVE